jgi:hypothetical protein
MKFAQRQSRFEANRDFTGRLATRSHFEFRGAYGSVAALGDAGERIGLSRRGAIP